MEGVDTRYWQDTRWGCYGRPAGLAGERAGAGKRTVRGDAGTTTAIWEIFGAKKRCIGNETMYN